MSMSRCPTTSMSQSRRPKSTPSRRALLNPGLPLFTTPSRSQKQNRRPSRTPKLRQKLTQQPLRALKPPQLLCRQLSQHTPRGLLYPLRLTPARQHVASPLEQSICFSGLQIDHTATLPHMSTQAWTTPSRLRQCTCSSRLPWEPTPSGPQDLPPKVGYLL